MKYTNIFIPDTYTALSTELNPARECQEMNDDYNATVITCTKLTAENFRLDA